MNPFFRPLFWTIGKLNPKMKVVALQTVPMESFGILEQYRDKSDMPHQRGSIVDLGGGGEGVIGQFLGRSVTAVDIRQDELDEAPDGPFKVVADARALPFEDDSFYCATAFYFLMYLKPEDYHPVFAEVSRVLKEGGRWIVWDTEIPKAKTMKLRTAKDKLFVVPVRYELPTGSQQTAYGVKWNLREMNAQLLSQVASKYRLRLVNEEIVGQAFRLIFVKE